MDILSLIKDQVSEIKKLSYSVNLDEVIMHIERAEFYYLEGKSMGDDHYFTDVIYRCNQAFEGSLKQSFIVLAQKAKSQADKTRPVDIEVFFEQSKIYNDRVLHYFRQYRQEWRNKSTHDFKLFFNQHEAFLGLANVTSYIYLLFFQIIEKLAFENERGRLIKEKGKQEIISEIIKNTSLDLDEKITELIKEFSFENEHLTMETNEIEILAMFSAFIKATSSDLELYTDFNYPGSNKNYRLDMLLRIKKEELMIEIKRPSLQVSDSHQDQVEEYLYATGLKNAVLWYPKAVWSKEHLDIETMSYFGREVKHITVIK